MAKSLVIADLPTLDEKILSEAKHWLNQSQKTKLPQSDTHKGYTVSFSLVTFHAALGRGFYTDT